MLSKKHLFILLFCVTLFKVAAQELPPIQVYTPQMYQADNQNWAITQSTDKYLYIGNNRGLLEYNGATWQLYPSPNETIIRSVAIHDNKIYTGCYMEFGYWLRNDLGLLEYTSLSKSLNVEMIEDEHFWKIIPLNDWIVFQSLNRIYLYNTRNQEIKIISSDTTITKMFLVDDSIMFQKSNDGIYMIENGVSKLLTPNDIVKDEEVVNMFSQNGNYLIQTVSSGFYKLEDNKLSKWNIEADKILTKVNVYSSVRLKDNSFVIGTISEGIIHLNVDGSVNYRINQANGLSNNTVLSLFEDEDNNLWLGLDNGINCINMGSPLKVFNDQKGNLGTIYASALYKGYLYLGTNQGLFYKEEASNKEFSFIEGTEGQVWNLMTISDTLFCGHNEGTFVVDDGKIQKIANISGTWDIKAIPSKPNLLLQGNYGGLNILEKINGTWRFKNSINGFNNSCRIFEFGADDNIYVSHGYKGLYRLRINEDYTGFSEISKIDELSKSLVKYNNDLLFSDKKGFYKYDIASKEFLKDSILSSVFTSDDFETGTLVMDQKSNRLWRFANKYIGYINPGKLSSIPEFNKIAMSKSQRKELAGFENIKRIGNDTYLFGTSNGYLVIDLKTNSDKKYDVKINSIKKGKRGIADTFVTVTDGPKFENYENNIEFSFSVAEFNKYTEVEYMHNLEGMYNEWSNWSTKPNVFYENLPHGEYTFNVSARIGDKEIGNAASYSFIIEKPWYLSNLMVAIYLICLLAFSLLMHMMYRRYYKKQQDKLLEKSKRDLELIQLENEQQRMQFENETLSKDIESKNRELAISTMSLIKKNEFLNDIKKELNTDEPNQKLKSVVKIIDKNLNNTDDWKFFEEAFNNADKDFLKKIKGLHPGLTSNDLRLCAYLRLNLSSKEIAPLLNISPRSVEVKRYRLRKKMKLEHEVSLTNYILEI